MATSDMFCLSDELLFRVLDVLDHPSCISLQLVHTRLRAQIQRYSQLWEADIQKVLHPRTRLCIYGASAPLALRRLVPQVEDLSGYRGPGLPVSAAREAARELAIHMQLGPLASGCAQESMWASPKVALGCSKLRLLAEVQPADSRVCKEVICGQIDCAEVGDNHISGFTLDTNLLHPGRVARGFH